MREKYKGAIFLALAAAIWGGMYVVSKFALDTIPPMTLLFIRYIIASIVMGVICWIHNISILPQKNWGAFIQIGGIGYFLSIGAQFIGTKYSTAHMGSLITTLSPLFLSLFAMIILKEKMKLSQGLALLLAISGLLIIVGVPGGYDQANTLVGICFLLIAAISWGYYSVISRKTSIHHSPLQITTLGIWVATLCAFPATYIERNDWVFEQLFSFPIMLSSLYLGIVSTAIAYFCWNKGLQLVPSHQAGLFFFLQPVVGSFLGWLFLDEILSFPFFSGSAFIVVGVYWSMKTERASSA